MLISANISLRQLRKPKKEDEPKDLLPKTLPKKDNNLDNENQNKLVKIITDNKEDWKNSREYKKFIESLSEEELIKLNPDEVRLKLSQIYEWGQNEDKYKNNV